MDMIITCGNTSREGFIHQLVSDIAHYSVHLLILLLLADNKTEQRRFVLSAVSLQHSRQAQVTRHLQHTIWSISFLGGTVGMPSKGYSMVAISSKTSACGDW